MSEEKSIFIQKIFYFIYYTVATIGASLLFYYAEINEHNFLKNILFVYFSFLIFIGLLSYSKMMLVPLIKNQNFMTLIIHSFFNPYLRGLYGIISALPFLYFGYNVFGFFIILAFFGEMTAYRRVDKLYLEHIEKDKKDL